MIRNIPKSLIESAKKQITEAVALKGHIAMAKKASNQSKLFGKTEAEIISQHVIPLGEDTTVLPLERDTATPHPDVVDHLDKHGYDVHDYMKGLAIKKGEKKNPISIGKVLARTDAPQSLKTAYEKDPSRQGIDSSVHIVISRNPVHVAGMSTHQNWESCQTLGGGGKYVDENGTTKNLDRQDVGDYHEFVPKDIYAGSHIAYLVHKPEDVDKHYAPIARILLKPYTSQHGHTILKPMQTYGEEWNGFHSSVQKWADKHFPMKDPEYTIDSSVYQDGPKKAYNFGEEHNEYWKNHQNDTTLAMHPSDEVITHYINNTKRSMPGMPEDAQNRHHRSYVFSALAKNPHLKEHHVLELLRHPATPEYAKGSLFYFPSSKVVELGMSDQFYHHHVVSNPNLTSTHLEDLIHQHESKFSANDETDHVSLTPDHGKILNGIATHKNLLPEQANHLIGMSKVKEYPYAIEHLFKKASDDHIEKTLDSLAEDRESLQYYDKAFSSLAKHKPHFLPKMNNLMIYHAYNDINRKSETAKRVEQEMLSRGDAFHGIVVRSSQHPSILQHIADTAPNLEHRNMAKAKLEGMTK